MYTYLLFMHCHCIGYVCNEVVLLLFHLELPVMTGQTCTLFFLFLFDITEESVIRSWHVVYQSVHFAKLLLYVYQQLCVPIPTYEIHCLALYHHVTDVKMPLKA